MLSGLRGSAGIGVDLVDVAALARKLAIAPGLEERTFSATERQVAAGLAAERRASFLAGRFAAKEAVLKALGVGLSAGVDLRQVEVAAGALGEPLLQLRAAALDLARERGFTRFAVSISHDGGFAIAFVLLSSSNPD